MEEIIIEQNPWWKNKDAILEDEKIENALKRKHRLTYELKEKENILFIGPRQVGKTTMFKLLILDLLRKISPRQVCYLSCELLKNYKEIVDAVRKMSMIAEPKYIFLDEVSFVEDWYKAIKYILDAGLLKNKLLYITGSSSIELKKERFPGRNLKIRYFLPLTFRHFIELFGTKELIKEVKGIEFGLHDVKELFERSKRLIPFKPELDKLLYLFLQTGGFPRAFYELIEEGKIREETYEIYWNWLMSDVAKLDRSEKIAIGVIEGIIKNYGTKFSLSSIAKETEIGSHVTVRDYLEILENLIAIRNFYNFDINKKKLVFRKMRKAYFIDPFILHACNFKLFGTPYKDNSKIVESLVVEHLTRKLGSLNIGFYHNKKEVDACFNSFGVEVKWKEKVSEKDFPRIDVKNKLLVSKNDFAFSKIAIIPASIFLALV